MPAHRRCFRQLLAVSVLVHTERLFELGCSWKAGELIAQCLQEDRNLLRNLSDKVELLRVELLLFRCGSPSCATTCVMRVP